MKYFLLLLSLFILFFVAVSAQITEDFTDGDFTNNPTWNGTDTNFTINTSMQLQLNDAGSAATSYLSTASTIIDSTEWQFYAKLSFSPSSQNYARVYLVADQADLSSPTLSGYFIQLGESGSADGIDLYRVNSGTETQLINGIDGHVANSTNTLKIKVTRSNSGLWKLYADTLGGTNFLSEGSATDASITSASYFGMVCTYTSSNSTKFYFDDFYVGNIIVDTMAPTVVSVNAVSNTSIQVEFSEAVGQFTAENTINYGVNNGIGTPVSATIDGTNPSIVNVTCATAFTNGTNYTLSVGGIEDLAGNIIASTSVPFVYYIPQAFDVLINEIMADPDPSVGLPEYEYVEIYNRTNFAINLAGWTFTAGTTTKEIPVVTINANSYIILTSDDAEWLLVSYGTTVVVESFPSITNDGQTLVLKNENGYTISTVTYSTDTYKDDAKKDGGWSLEMIDPNNPCGGEDNWKASSGTSGGTPGTQNSVYASNGDNSSPELDRVSVIDSVTIQLFFSEPLDSTTLYNLTDYSIDNTIGNPIAASPVAPDYASVILTLATPLQVQTIYNIVMGDSVTDCVGNLIVTASTARFAIPEEIDSLDIVINEVVYNTLGDGVEWIEVYNRSSKILDLSELVLTKVDESTGNLESADNISDVGVLLFPSEYMVLSTNSDNIKSQYYSSNPKYFVDMESFPSLTDGEGSVVIARKNLTIIDEFNYSDDLQFALLSSFDGVSLERIDFDRPTQDAGNWHSAAADVGYATPAYENSQYLKTESTSNMMALEPKLFSPDNDGYNDVLNISYYFDTPGNVANVSIYDARGRLVKRLVKNELLGTSGIYTWNGLTDADEKVRIGIYMVYFESFDLEGKVSREKQTCVVGGKL